MPEKIVPAIPVATTVKKKKHKHTEPQKRQREPIISSSDESDDSDVETVESTSSSSADEKHRRSKRRHLDISDKHKKEVQFTTAGRLAAPDRTSASAMLTKYLEELPVGYERSFLKINNAAQTADYEHPWRGMGPAKWSGSGFVLEYKGKKFILTNAHVADSSVYLQVRFADESNYYRARVVVIEHDCDLAYLEVTKNADEFWAKANCLQLGEMFSMGQTVNVCGFPVGGEELCVTDGKVSRIEVSDYVHSGVELLQGQVSAATNPGNSGGAVVCNKKVIGVAFQGGEREGQGYIIPPPIVTHFLDDILSGEYKGFPALEFDWQQLENESVRIHNGMEPKETGIRLIKIDLLSSARKLLKEGDIITKVDGHLMQNDGTIDTPFSKRISFDYLVSQKHIGDTISIEVIRAGKRLLCNVPLLNKAGTTKVVPPEEHGMQPTYYIASGIVFMPLTKNLLQDGSFDEDGIEDKPKLQLGQQLVIINNILASELVEGYDKFANTKVKLINGNKIFNMRDVVYAIESNTGPVHSIVNYDGGQIVVKNLNAIDNAKLLQRFKIKEARSVDLAPEVLAHGVKYEVGYPETWMTEDRLPSPERPSSPVELVPTGGRAKYLGFSNFGSGVAKRPLEVVVPEAVNVEDEMADKRKQRKRNR